MAANYDVAHQVKPSKKLVARTDFSGSDFKGEENEQFR